MCILVDNANMIFDATGNWCPIMKRLATQVAFCHIGKAGFAHPVGVDDVEIQIFCNIFEKL